MALVGVFALLWGVVHQAHTEDVGRLARAVLARWPDTSHPMRADVLSAVGVAATGRPTVALVGDLGDEPPGRLAVRPQAVEVEIQEHRPSLQAGLAQLRQARRTGDVSSHMDGAV